MSPFRTVSRLAASRPLARWAIALGLGMALAATACITALRRPALTPVLRGERVARQAGCFGCHGPAGLGGGSNPGSRASEIPPLRAGASIMFYVQNEAELREWVLNGAPDRLRNDPGSETRFGQRGVIRMPSYRGLLSEGDVEDLVAYVKSVSLPRTPEAPEQREGRAIASRLGCFNCHGIDGSGGLANPGSFVGIIPPWDGDDFDELVENEHELRQWILEGVIDRFESNPAAAFFLDRQAIQMPAYQGLLEDDELDSLVAYIRWLRDDLQGSPSPWLRSSDPGRLASVVDRGAWLYQRAGCVACHGPDGAGQVPNENAAGGFVPPLDDLAEKLEIFEPGDVASILSGMETTRSFEALAASPPMAGFEAVLSRYRELRGAILDGGVVQKRDPEGREPPMAMPGWRHRTHADDGPTSISDIDSIVAYLLTLQPWDDEV